MKVEVAELKKEAALKKIAAVGKRRKGDRCFSIPLEKKLSANVIAVCEEEPLKLRNKSLSKRSLDLLAVPVQVKVAAVFWKIRVDAKICRRQANESRPR